MDAAGEEHGVWQVTYAGLDSSPSCAPDGSRLAFARDGTGIVVVDLASGEETQVTFGPSDGDPAWSPDGQLIAFERLVGNWDVWVTDDTGTSPVERWSWGRVKALFR
jgi:Tol biopolymer transport system component